MSDTTELKKPSLFIRVLAHISTILHFIESVGAIVILWLYPSLTPEPRMRQYITPTHPHHHHHHHHTTAISHRHQRRSNSYQADRSKSVDPLELRRALEVGLLTEKDLELEGWSEELLATNPNDLLH